MKIRILIFTVILCFSSRAYGQSLTKLQREFVNTALSDTFMGYGYLIPLKIKLKDTDTIKICYQETQYLFSYFREKFGWSGLKFMDTMQHYLLRDKVLIVDDENYFKTKKEHSINQCAKTYKGINKKDLISIINKKRYKRPLEACLVYQCFTKRILLCHIEEGIEIGKFPVGK